MGCRIALLRLHNAEGYDKKLCFKIKVCMMVVCRISKHAVTKGCSHL